jgi:TonB-dependent SusC/RagA subfamily outer membrane receptor
LNEVVVVGFGTQKKSNLTGAVSQVKMDEVLGDRPVTTVASALQGAVPGLNITNSSTPGTAAAFNIRGVTSINGGGALVLIDNAEGDINMLTPEDVESVSVLKDAASTAIYGARAAFGVVLVTTKKAKKNSKTVFSYNNNFAYTKPINQVEQAPIADIVHTLADWSNTPLVGGPTKQNLV